MAIGAKDEKYIHELLERSIHYLPCFVGNQSILRRLQTWQPKSRTQDLLVVRQQCQPPIHCIHPLKTLNHVNSCLK